MTSRVIALHGFGGLPTDWNQFEDALAAKNWSLIKINLFEKKITAFQEWSKDLASKLSGFEGRQVLLGYSLGGRLAAHVLLQKPELFAAAIFVSTNPGLKTDTERLERMRSDDLWAKKWATDTWLELQREWNAQPVFQSPYSKPPTRNEADYDRRVVAEAMQLWSLGEQADLRAPLAACSVRQLWLAGEDDQKFVKLGQEMVELSTSLAGQVRFEAVPQAGHRVCWDHPAAFANSVASFLESL